MLELLLYQRASSRGTKGICLDEFREVAATCRHYMRKTPYTASGSGPQSATRLNKQTRPIWYIPFASPLQTRKGLKPPVRVVPQLQLQIRKDPECPSYLRSKSIFFLPYFVTAFARFVLLPSYFDASNQQASPATAATILQSRTRLDMRISRRPI